MTGRRRPARTLRATLTRAVAVPVLVLACGAGGYGVTAALIHLGIVPAVLVRTDAHPAPTPDQVHAHQVAALLTRFSCWSGTAPAAWSGRFPAGVVVTIGDAPRPVHWSSPDQVGRALDAALSGGRTRLTVHGFCAH